MSVLEYNIIGEGCGFRVETIRRRDLLVHTIHIEISTLDTEHNFHINLELKCLFDVIIMIIMLSACSLFTQKNWTSQPTRTISGVSCSKINIHHSELLTLCNLSSSYEWHLSGKSIFGLSSLCIISK